jgi:predicted PurR-regulated permease PerM
MPLGKDVIPVSITAGSVARIIAVGALFYLLYFLRDLLLVLLTAIVIASAVEPTAKFAKRYRISRLVAIIVVYVAVAAVLAAMFYFFIPVLANDINTLLSSLPQYVDSISVWNPFSDSAVLGFGKAKEFAEGIALSSGTTIPQSEGVLAAISRLSAAISEGGLLQTASYFFGGFLSFVLIIVLSFYLAVQENGIEKFLRLVIPKRHEVYVVGLWQRSQEKIALWAQGQFVLALLVGILVYLGLTLLGVRNALLFALLAALFEIIPLFGPILAAIPAVAVSFIDGGLSAGLVTVGLYVVIQQFENHLIYPLVVQKIVGISPIIVILALLAGFKIAGFLGVLLSVPLATILVEVINDFEKEKARRYQVPA